jgi:hypothetical protein
MKLDGEQASILGRRNSWFDGVPRWMNRLAHIICGLLVGDALTVPLGMWWKQRTFAESLDWLTMGAISGAIAYGVALVVYEVGRSRSAGRSSSSGA